MRLIGSGATATQDQRQAKWAALVEKQKAKPHIESATLTPAGKFTDAMASDIYKRLKKQSKSPLVVEGYQFEDKRRVMDAIHDLANQLQIGLKKQARKHQTDF